MTYQSITLNHAENVGTLDRVSRLIVSMTLFTVTVLFTAIPEAAIAGLVAVGFYTGLTAFIGWDPLYALANAYRSQGSVHTAPSTTSAVRPHKEPISTFGAAYKQAA